MSRYDRCEDAGNKTRERRDILGYAGSGGRDAGFESEVCAVELSSHIGTLMNPSMG